jgi:hypothetical protein
MSNVLYFKSTHGPQHHGILLPYKMLMGVQNWRVCFADGDDIDIFQCHAS